MNKPLRIAASLSLPLDAVTQKIAWLGRTGSGKTFGCKRMVEQMLRANAQVVILDGSGGWAGLRLGPKAFKIPVFGGLYGDIPLEPTAGALIADVIVDRRLSVVLDVSQMLDAERTRFATAFAQRFFQRQKASPSAVHLVLEECQDFVPENCQRGEEQMLHQFQRLAKQGRPHGIGISFISQRPQEISKKALNQAECVFAFQMNGPHERKALQYWLTDKGFNGQLADVLPRLEIGHPYVWSPQWLKISEVVRILPIDSRDTSKTPEVGRRGSKKKRETLKPIDLKALKVAMAETIERVKTEDPKELNKQIAELKKELGIAKQDAQKKPASAPKRVEVQVVSEKMAKRLEKALDSMKTTTESMLGLVDKLKEAIAPVRFQKTQPTVSQTTSRGKSAVNGVKKKLQLTEKYRPNRDANGDSKALPAGERVVLTAIAQHPDGVTREQLTVLTGYKSSTRNAYVLRLSNSGFVEPGVNGTIVATPAGIDELGDFSPLPTGRYLLEYWLERLPAGERKILEIVSEIYPGSIERSELDEPTGFKTSTRNAYLLRLSTRKLVTGKNDIRLSEALVG